MVSVVGFISTVIVSALSGLVAAYVTVNLNKKYYDKEMDNNVRKYKFALYINTKQMKRDISDAKKRLDNNDKLMVSPFPTYRGFDYLNALCILMDELSEEEVDILMQYYDNCMIFDNYRISLNGQLARINEKAKANPALLLSQDPDYVFFLDLYKKKLNELSNEELYSTRLVSILDKLK